MHPGLERVRGRIASACARVGRDPSSVKLVAVTKGRSLAEVRALIRAGQRDLAENRVQEWRSLAGELEGEVAGELAGELAGEPLRWHLVGHLQRNKVRYCRGFDLIHSLDSERLARALDSAGAKHRHVFRTLLQVNVSGEASKHGVAVDEVAGLLGELRALEHVKVEGLMTMAPYGVEEEQARAVFGSLRDVAERLALAELSMGMSGDLEIAVEEGATLVRVGTALFEG